MITTKEILTTTHSLSIIDNESEFKLGIRNLNDPSQYLLIDVTASELNELALLLKDFIKAPIKYNYNYEDPNIL